MYEASHQKIIAKRLFLKRMLKSILKALGLIIISLFIGMLGYHYFEKMPWVDAYVNAAMILSGMGPMGELKTDAGKTFAGTYAIFSGIIFLVIFAIVMAPVIHRFLHHFHLEPPKSTK